MLSHRAALASIASRSSTWSTHRLPGPALRHPELPHEKPAQRSGQLARGSASAEGRSGYGSPGSLALTGHTGMTAQARFWGEAFTLL